MSQVWVSTIGRVLPKLVFRVRSRSTVAGESGVIGSAYHFHQGLVESVQVQMCSVQIEGLIYPWLVARVRGAPPVRTMNFTALRETLSEMDDPYIHVVDGDTEYPQLHIEPMGPNNPPFGVILNVSEFYVQGDDVDFEDDPELVNVSEIAFEKQPDGGYKTEVHSDYEHEGEIKVRVSKHPDAL